jgi:glucose/arabinose dehydrogenase
VASTSAQEFGRPILFAQGLEEPVCAAFAPGDTSRLFVLGRFGRIWIIETRPGSVRATPFIDLLPLVCCHPNANMAGLAFDPDYATNGYFYVHYQGVSGYSAVDRYTRSANPDVADPGTARTVIRTPRVAFGHNGGWIGFSPVNHLLYVTEGDSGSGVASDPEGASQNMDDLRGKMLRIDPRGDDFPSDSNRNYHVPASNPFVGRAGADEIWASGLRNPFMASFDRLTGDLWIGDVGQDTREEVDVQPFASVGGENYGWRCAEGDVCTGLPGCVCPNAGFTAPLWAYAHGDGCSIVGGVVYRGASIAALRGSYLFSDYCSCTMWTLTRNGGAPPTVVDRSAALSPPATSPHAYQFLTSIGEDARGELYVVDYQAGRVFKIVPSCVADVDDGSDTGVRDGGLGIEDLLHYLALYDLGVVMADVDDGSGLGTQDAGVGIEDLLYFLARFDAGC